MQTTPRSGRPAFRTGILATLPLLMISTTAATPLPSDPPASARLAHAQLWVDPGSAAVRQVDAWRRARPSAARLLEKISSQPQAVWFGDWNREIRRDVERVVGAARAGDAVPVLVAYNIPQRDCGSHSAGGARQPETYRRWIREFAAGIGGRPAIVILEPDAVAGADCLDQHGRRQRFQLLSDAVETLKAAGAFVYVDAGHARWHSPEEIATRLGTAGIDGADGFALNVSNFNSNEVSIAYGERVSALTGGKHFVVDTSRNGLGTASPNDWCNPSGQALGTIPTTRTSHRLVDAFLWVKRPGESDGTCNGGPPAGQWWPEYALGLAERQTRSIAVAMTR